MSAPVATHPAVLPRRRRTGGRLAVAALVVSVPLLDARSVVAQPDDREVTLAIATQDFGIAPGGRWTATVSLDGDLAELLAAVPATTTTPTTAGPSTSTSTSPSTSTSTSSSTSTTGTPTTTTTVPDPATARATVEIRAHDRVETTDELTDAVDGEVGTVVDRVTVPLATALRPGATPATRTLQLDVETASEAGDPRLTLRRAGLYPLSVAVRVDGTTVAETTTFIERLDREPDPDPPIGVTLLGTVAEPGPTPTPAEQAAAADHLDELAALGAAAGDAPLTVALPPDVAAAATPAQLDALDAALGRTELLSLPALELDPSSAVAIDRTDAFSRELRRGEELLADALPAVPTRRTAWLVTTPLSTPAAATLRDPLGFRTLVFDAESYGELDGSIGDFTDSSLSFEVDLGDGNVLPAFVLSPLGEALDPGRDDGTTPAESAVRLLAEVVVVRRELGTEDRRNVVVAPPGLGLPDADVVAALVGAAAEVPHVELTSLSRAASATDGMEIDDEPLTVRLPDEAGVDLAARDERIELTRVSVEAYASMLDDGGASLDAWQAELDALLSTGVDDATADAALDELGAELEAIRTSVEPPAPFTFTLTGRRQTLRFNLRNTADESRTVLVRASSPKLDFPDGDLRVVLQPGENEVSLDVEARANGTSSVAIELLTPVFGQRIAEPTFLTAKVNALAGLGQVITGGALIVLATWWVSHLRRRPRARAALVPIVVTDDEPVLSPDAAEVVAEREDDLTAPFEPIDGDEPGEPGEPAGPEQPGSVSRP